MTDTYDVVIAGGNMVGAALGCALGTLGLRAAVVEPRKPARAPFPAPHDLRVSALTRATQHMFENLGVWPAMEAQGVSPFREMRVWDAGGAGRLHFDSADLGEPALGYIVENRVIQAALVERLRELPAVEWLCPDTVDAFEVGVGGVSVATGEGRRLEARLLVGADGSDSRIRQLARIPVRGWPYEQTAVVATVRTERSHAETAWQRFLPTGPVAFLPFADGACSIVWSTTPEHADELMVMDDASFCARLSQAFEYALGQVVETSPRASFPLRLRHAARYVDLRIALVGDAAHMIHPLAGQGANLGFMDAAALAEVVVSASPQRRDPGELAVLRRYERWRKGENMLMMSSMDVLKRLFGADAMPVRLARNWGMGLVNAAGPMKHGIMRRAMGLSGDLPRLARRA